MKRFIFAFAIIALHSASSQADPAISSLNLTDTFQHGQTYTITGVAFGDKDSPEPVSWDNAEDRYSEAERADGLVVPTDSDPYSGYPFRVNPAGAMLFGSSPDRHHRGVSLSHYIGDYSVSGHQDFNGYDYNPEGVGHGHREMYISWWIRMDKPTTSASSKLIRLWANDFSGRTYRLSWTTSHLTYSYVEDTGILDDEGNRTWTMEGHGLIPEGYQNWVTWRGESELNQWHRIELYYRASSTPTTSDGKFLTMTDGHVEHDIDFPTWLAPWPACDGCVNQTTRGGDNPLNHIWIFGMDPSIPENIGDYMLELDDIYIDFSQARVELCNVPTWSQRAGANCEVQIPSRWTSSEIDFTGNVGSLGGEEAFLYVVDANGEVNEEGFLLTVSDEAPIRDGSSGGTSSVSSGCAQGSSGLTWIWLLALTIFSQALRRKRGLAVI